jgi:hypothetical protein
MDADLRRAIGAAFDACEADLRAAFLAEIAPRLLPRVLDALRHCPTEVSVMLRDVGVADFTDDPAETRQHRLAGVLAGLQTAPAVGGRLTGTPGNAASQRARSGPVQRRYARIRKIWQDLSGRGLSDRERAQIVADRMEVSIWTVRRAVKAAAK